MPLFFISHGWILYGQPSYILRAIPIIAITNSFKNTMGKSLLSVFQAAGEFSVSSPHCGPLSSWWTGCSSPRPPGPQAASTQCLLLVLLHQPGQQGVDVVRGGRVRTQWWGCHKRSCFGPVLAPVMGSVCTKAGSDGLAKDHVSCKRQETGRAFAKALGPA